MSSSLQKNTLPPTAGSVKGAVVIARFGHKLRLLRERAGLSQTELARLIGLSERSKGYISEIESGKKIPPAGIVLRIAQYFNVTTDYLLRDDVLEQDN